MNVSQVSTNNYVKTKVENETQVADVKENVKEEGKESIAKKPSRMDFYAKSRLSADDVKKVNILKEEIKKQSAQFESFIGSMITKQGDSANSIFQSISLNFGAANSSKASEAIGSGDFSSNAVASRIMDMAKSLSGGDKSKIAVLKDAVIKGFNAAGVKLGKKMDEMPQVTTDTFNEVMARFEAWGKE